jgi:hypothetical protein
MLSGKNRGRRKSFPQFTWDYPRAAMQGSGDGNVLKKLWNRFGERSAAPERGFALLEERAPALRIVTALEARLHRCIEPAHVGVLRMARELAFSVTGKPGWMEFDSQSGALTGHPSGKDVGKYKGIKIRVSDGTASAELDNIDVEVIPATGSANQPPQISGTPSSAVLVGTFYAFVPTVSDPEGDPLSFTIQNLPRWASFDPANGRLSGMPTAADVGTYTGITITVADGELRDALGPFAIQVITVATGTASLSWLPPTENEDGSALGDLGGYIVYWGAESRNYASSATIDNLAVTGYVVDNLIPGETYYFSVTAYNLSGIESSFSNEGSKTIQ